MADNIACMYYVNVDYEEIQKDMSKVIIDRSPCNNINNTQCTAVAPRPLNMNRLVWAEPHNHTILPVPGLFTFAPLPGTTLCPSSNIPKIPSWRVRTGLSSTSLM